MLIAERGMEDMKLNKEQAYYMLTNLDSFVSSFEKKHNTKVGVGALQIVHELLLEKSFPEGYRADKAH